MSAASMGWLLLLSMGASALGGLLGIASGIFIVPLLALFAHVDLRAAIGASLISVIACSCGSAAAFLREGLTNIRLAVLLEVATTLGATTGVLLFGILPVGFLYLLFAAILFLSARQMWARRDARAASASSGWAPVRGSYPDRESGVRVHYSVSRLPLGMGLMARWRWARSQVPCSELACCCFSAPSGCGCGSCAATAVARYGSRPRG